VFQRHKHTVHSSQKRSHPGQPFRLITLPPDIKGKHPKEFSGPYETARHLSLPFCPRSACSTSLFWPDRESPRKITTPKTGPRFNIGDDYYLANYVQLTSYWQTLAQESDRMKLVDIGPTAENPPQYMAIISSPRTSRSSITTKKSPPN